MRGKIGARHREIQGRQTMCLVFRVQQLFRRFAVLGPEAALLAGFVVLPVEDAVRSLEEPVFVQHGRRSRVGDSTPKVLPVTE